MGFVDAICSYFKTVDGMHIVDVGGRNGHFWSNRSVIRTVDPPPRGRLVVAERQRSAENRLLGPASDLPHKGQLEEEHMRLLQLPDRHGALARSFAGREVRNSVGQ